MMLPGDMALLWDKKFKKYVDLYAKDEEAFFKVGWVERCCCCCGFDT
jgi:hypothetical protein